MDVDMYPSGGLVQLPESGVGGGGKLAGVALGRLIASLLGGRLDGPHRGPTQAA